MSLFFQLSLASQLALALAALAAVLEIGFEAYRPQWAKVFAKPAVCAMLIVAVAFSELSSVNYWLLILGLGFAMIGDIALMLPSAQTKRTFAIGLGAFLLTHIIYCVLLLEYESQYTLAKLVLAIVLAIISAALLVPYSNTLKLPVAAYITAITLLFIQGSAYQGSNNTLLLLGIILFVCSDFLLGWNRFRQTIRHAQIGILSTYFSAQILIVSALILGL